MKTETDPPRTAHKVLLFLLSYALWLASIAACAAAVLQFSSAVNVALGAAGANRYLVRLANQVSLLLAGFVAFIYAVYLESYYRESAAQPALLLRRFARTVAIPLGVVLASLALIEVALRLMH